MQDVDKMELLLSSGKRLVAVGEKVMEDGKFSWADAKHAPEMFEAGAKFIQAVKAYKEIMDEAKDLDPAEMAKLGAIFLGK